MRNFSAKAGLHSIPISRPIMIAGESEDCSLIFVFAVKKSGIILKVNSPPPPPPPPPEQIRKLSGLKSDTKERDWPDITESQELRDAYLRWGRSQWVSVYTLYENTKRPNNAFQSTLNTFSMACLTSARLLDQNVPLKLIPPTT